MLPIEIVKLDHVAIASWDASRQARLLVDVLGATFHDGGDQRSGGFRWLQFTVGGGTIEVIEPLRPDTFLTRFLDRRGEGLHHMTFFVPDLAEAIPDLEAAGYTPVDVDLRHDDWKEAFLHPRDTGGVLVQLAETTDVEGPSEPSIPLETFLADRPGIGPEEVTRR